MCIFSFSFELSGLNQLRVRWRLLTLCISCENRPVHPPDLIAQRQVSSDPPVGDAGLWRPSMCLAQRPPTHGSSPHVVTSKVAAAWRSAASDQRRAVRLELHADPDVER